MFYKYEWVSSAFFPLNTINWLHALLLFFHLPLNKMGSQMTTYAMYYYFVSPAPAWGIKKHISKESGGWKEELACE